MAKGYFAKPGEVQVARALLSVSDKTGIVEFARGLSELGVEIVSTGGTAQRAARRPGIEVRSISDFTGFPEIMDGRVKTLHPKLYAGLLAGATSRCTSQAADEQGVELVDLVCVNLYPFERTSARRGVADAEVVENIDIGGPTMIRAAAKNFAFAAAVVAPGELRRRARRAARRRAPALARHARVAGGRGVRLHRALRHRDRALVRRARGGLPAVPRARVREGHRPRLRREPAPARRLLRAGRRAHARAVDGPAARRQGALLQQPPRPQRGAAAGAEFQVPACAIIKHNNPCGVALGESALDGLPPRLRGRPAERVRRGDLPQPRRRTRELAEAIVEQFAEVVFAPGFDEDALEVLSSKPNMRILEDNERRTMNVVRTRTLKRVIGGLLVQDRDMDLEERSEMQVVTERQPSERRVGGDAVRLEGVQARALERDRAGSATSRRWGSGPVR